MIIPKLQTGQIEVDGSSISVLNESETLPFEISRPVTTTKERLRLQYRYIDLRRPKLQNMMKTATVDSRAARPWCQRNEAIKRIGEVGRRQWRKESGAHQQARAENGIYRYKRIIADHLRAKHREAQKTEALIAVDVINRMTELGMPESAKIVT